jgi:hydrogenase-4 component H
VPSPAAEAYRGEGQFDEKECIGCGGCAEVCPADAIEVIDYADREPPVRAIVRHHDECIFCGQCEAQCTTEKGVHLTNEYELSCLDRNECIVSIEKELVLCEMCGVVITTKDHLRWIARKLGAKRFANPTLTLTAEAGYAVVDGGRKTADRPTGREDIMRVLCPACRREVVIEEIWG